MARYSLGQVHPAVRRMILSCPKAIDMLDEFQKAHLEYCQKASLSTQEGVYTSTKARHQKQYVLINREDIKVVLSATDSIVTLVFRTHDDRFWLVNNSMRLGFKLPGTVVDALHGKLIGEIVEGLPPGFEKTFIKQATQAADHTMLYLGARLVTVPRERNRQKAILANI